MMGKVHAACMMARVHACMMGAGPPGQGQRRAQGFRARAYQGAAAFEDLNQGLSVGLADVRKEHILLRHAQLDQLGLGLCVWGG